MSADGSISSYGFATPPSSELDEVVYEYEEDEEDEEVVVDGSLLSLAT